MIIEHSCVVMQLVKKLIEKYRCVKDTEGMSPAKVYKLVGENENLYLKMTAIGGGGRKRGWGQRSVIPDLIRNLFGEILNHVQDEGVVFPDDGNKKY